jgi:hypothetical protein
MKPRKSGVLWLEVPCHVRSRPVNEHFSDPCPTTGFPIALFLHTSLPSRTKAKVGRNPGQWTPAAVETWRSAEPEMARMLDAAFALELKLNRKVTAADEDLVRGM